MPSRTIFTSIRFCIDMSRARYGVETVNCDSGLNDGISNGGCQRPARFVLRWPGEPKRRTNRVHFVHSSERVQPHCHSAWFNPPGCAETIISRLNIANELLNVQCNITASYKEGSVNFSDGHMSTVRKPTEGCQRTGSFQAFSSR